jgi:hypothetical protein
MMMWRIFSGIGVVFALALPASGQSKAYPDTAFEPDVSQIRQCAYHKFFEDALDCVGDVADKCYGEGYAEGFDSTVVCVRREWLAWEEYRKSQLAQARDRFGAAGVARVALEKSVEAFAPWRAAECASEQLSWEPGSEEGADSYEFCMLHLTAQRAVGLGLKGIP